MTETAAAQTGATHPQETGDVQSGVITLLSGNLLAGGIGRTRRSRRFDPLMDAAAQQHPDIACFQECLYWDEDGNRLLHQAEHVLGMRGVLGISPHTRMHTAVLVRPPLRVVASAVHSGGVWHHSVTRVVVAWDEASSGAAGQAVVASVHLSPHSVTRRVQEAEMLASHADARRLVILAGDFNTSDRHTDLSSADPSFFARDAVPGTAIPDTSPIDRLLAAGFTDVAEQSPNGAAPLRTTGHWPGHAIASRPDRILASPAAAARLHGYQVIETAAAFSDHHWLLARLHRDTIDARTLGTRQAPDHVPATTL